MVNVQYPAGQGAPAHAALLVVQGIQPADELAVHGAQAAGSQVAQVVQQVDGQEVLPAAEHVAQEIQPAAEQVPQQAMEQVQQELEVEYVYFCGLCQCTFYKLRTGTMAATLYLFSFFLPVSVFPFVLCSCFSQFVCCC